MTTPKKVVSAVVRIPQDMNRRLTNLAKQSGRSKVYYLKKALTSYFEDLEDLAVASAAEDEMKHGGWLSHEDIKKKLGLVT